MTDDERAIRELIQTWMTASKQGDTPTVLSLMADDVVFMTPGRAPFGREAFARTAEDMKGVAIDGRSEVLEVEVAGSWAWARSKLDVTVTPKGGEAKHRSGYVLSIFRKEPTGDWVLARDANLLT